MCLHVCVQYMYIVYVKIISLVVCTYIVDHGGPMNAISPWSPWAVSPRDVRIPDLIWTRIWTQRLDAKVKVEAMFFFTEITWNHQIVSVHQLPGGVQQPKVVHHSKMLQLIETLTLAFPLGRNPNVVKPLLTLETCPTQTKTQVLEIHQTNPAPRPQPVPWRRSRHEVPPCWTGLVPPILEKKWPEMWQQGKM